MDKVSCVRDLPFTLCEGEFILMSRDMVPHRASIIGSVVGRHDLCLLVDGCHVEFVSCNPFKKGFVKLGYYRDVEFDCGYSGKVNMMFAARVGSIAYDNARHTKYIVFWSVDEYLSWCDMFDGMKEGRVWLHKGSMVLSGSMFVGGHPCDVSYSSEAEAVAGWNAEKVVRIACLMKVINEVRCMFSYLRGLVESKRLERGAGWLDVKLFQPGELEEGVVYYLSGECAGGPKSFEVCGWKEGLPYEDAGDGEAYPKVACDGELFIRKSDYARYRLGVALDGVLDKVSEWEVELDGCERAVGAFSAHDDPYFACGVIGELNVAHVESLWGYRIGRMKGLAKKVDDLSEVV